VVLLAFDSSAAYHAGNVPRMHFTMREE